MNRCSVNVMETERKKHTQREREERCAPEQNLPRSLSSAITVETSLFLTLSTACKEVIRESEQGRHSQRRSDREREWHSHPD